MDVHPALTTLRERIALEDELGRPLVVQIGKPPNDGTQRLMDSLGVTVEVRKVTAVTAAQIALQRGSAAFEYRASRARVVRRTEAGETPAVCSGCGTEVDVDAPSHAPGCRYFDVAAPAEVKTEGTHTANGSLTAAEMKRRHQEHLDEQPATTSCAHCPDWRFEGTLVESREAFELHRAEEHPEIKSSRGAADREAERARAAAARVAQQRALRALDGGEPQAELDDDRTSDFATSDEVEQDRPAEADADTTTTSVDVQDAEGADGAFPADSRVGGATISTGNDFAARRRRRKPYTEEEALAAFLRFDEEHSRHPLPSDVTTCAYLPSNGKGIEQFGGYRGIWERLGWGKLPQGRAAEKYRRDAIARAVSEGRQDQREPSQPDAADTSRDLPPDPEWAVELADVGLRYRTVEIAIAAADEIERDAERVAAGARESGATEAADRLITEARDLAETVRTAARAAESSSASSRTTDVVGDAVVSPADEQQQAGESAATADGSGGAGAQTPAPDPEAQDRVSAPTESGVVEPDEAPPGLTDGDAAKIANVLRALADAIDAGLFRRTNLAQIFDGLALEVRDRLGEAT